MDVIPTRHTIATDVTDIHIRSPTIFNKLIKTTSLSGNDPAPCLNCKKFGPRMTGSHRNRSFIPRVTLVAEPISGAEKLHGSFTCFTNWFGLQLHHYNACLLSLLHSSAVWYTFLYVNTTGDVVPRIPGLQESTESSHCHWCNLRPDEKVVLEKMYFLC